MKKHLAIFIGTAIEDILHRRKTMESRFSMSRVVPYGQVTKDDTILLKKSGGEILGEVVVDNVLYYDSLTSGSIAVLKKEYGKELCVDDKFWLSKSKSHYGTLIFLKNPERFLTPIKYQKHDRRPWVVLGK